MKYIKILAKCQDRLHMAIFDNDMNSINEEYSGYVPTTSLGGGDFIKMTIDNETGKIMNWEPITYDEYDFLAKSNYNYLNV